MLCLHARNLPEIKAYYFSPTLCKNPVPTYRQSILSSTIDLLCKRYFLGRINGKTLLYGVESALMYGVEPEPDEDDEQN